MPLKLMNGLQNPSKFPYMLLVCKYIYIAFRHPILVRVFERYPSPERCEEYEPRKHLSGDHIPAFIPESQRKILSTSEIFDMNYVDCFGPDTDENSWAAPVIGVE